MQQTKYVAKKPDKNGLIHYTEQENQVWNTLYHRQIKLIPSRACEAFVEGVELLNLTDQHVPQCKEVSEQLMLKTGWQVAPVEALISFQAFFQMLSEKTFPAASFIRIPKEIDYLQEPDIFHEIFGHCPMLMHQVFADFTEAVGHLGLAFDKKYRLLLARLYWFTVEFGLINTAQGLRIYGGGILSSKGEMVYALESEIPQRLPFDLLTVLRTPYRYDEMQLTYFVIDDLADLYKLTDKDMLMDVFKEVEALGELPNRHEMDADELRSC